MTFQDFKPYIEEIKKGDFKSFLAEPPVEWAMTRGTTGKSKIVPMTLSDLEQRTLCGARGLLNYVYRTNRYDVLQGYDLNIGFPSVVGSMRVGEREVNYGYSSGIYTKYNAERARLKIVPPQEEIDALGGGIIKRDWEKRFELIYEKAKDERVTMVIGVTQIMLQFGGWLKKRFKLYPKNIWDIKLLVCTSITGIHTKHKPALKGLYGDAEIVEMYGATEGMYGQQYDEKPFWVPNYDTCLFEVEMKKGIKMVYDLKPKEYGKIIISSCSFPRYRIGDLIMCMDRGYYRIIGRDRPFALLRYWFEQIWNL